MKLLVVTEKCGPEEAQRDGGARVVATLQRTFGRDVAVAQFGERADAAARWHFRYPAMGGDRFARRLRNATFVADRVRDIALDFTDVLFVHASMQFGLAGAPIPSARVWTFPMFLSPSYSAAGEVVPSAYTEAERRVLATTSRIITPSDFERRQLLEIYGADASRIRVVPRGIDRGALCPRARHLDGPPRICSVGSIKRQKDTLALIRRFAAVRARHPGALLRVVGPVQDDTYSGIVRSEVRARGLDRAVEFTGYVPPAHLGDAVQDAHIHMSASACETFGRSIFETLAAGLPNVARRAGNAAAEFLAHVPYARFHDEDAAAVEAVDILLAGLPGFSTMAMEIGELFDDGVLGRLLAAEIRGEEALAVSDFDGTLFHKDDAARTRQAVEEFGRFPARVVCSARSVPDLLTRLDGLGASADWVIGCSGAVVADGRGRTLWRTGLSESDLATLQRSCSGSTPVLSEGAVVQLATTSALPRLRGYRVETYQGTSYVARWEASKLRAVHRLLRHIAWSGRVRCFGDGQYDDELLTFFDGKRVGTTPCRGSVPPELPHA